MCQAYLAGLTSSNLAVNRTADGWNVHTPEGAFVTTMHDGEHRESAEGGVYELVAVRPGSRVQVMRVDRGVRDVYHWPVYSFIALCRPESTFRFTRPHSEYCTACHWHHSSHKGYTLECPPPGSTAGFRWAR